MLKNLLFDLDGTLLAFEQDVFVHRYFKLLLAYVADLGYDPNAFQRALMIGTEAMLENDGAESNRARFWRAFAEAMPGDTAKLEGECDSFYGTVFNEAQDALGETRALSALFQGLRKKGYRLALATNPLFPGVAVASRLGWIGLKPSDFDLVTTYENSYYTKPNPKYYEAVLQLLGADPSESLMIGNHPVDDMAAASLGMQTLLITDNIEPAEAVSVDPFPQMRFSELCQWLTALPPL